MKDVNTRKLFFLSIKGIVLTLFCAETSLKRLFLYVRSSAIICNKGYSADQRIYHRPIPIVTRYQVNIK